MFLDLKKTHTFYLELKAVTRVKIFEDTEIKVVKRRIFGPDVTETKKSILLRLDYITLTGNEDWQLFDCKNQSQAQGLHQEIVDQVKSQKDSIITAAFENALLGDDNGNSDK